MKIGRFLIVFWIAQWGISCNNNPSTAVPTKPGKVYQGNFIDTLYKSENLILRKITGNAYQHISYLNTNSFGKVSCNGMVVIKNNEAVIFDTPAKNDESHELINFLTKELNCRISAIIATHFHADCLGGLEAFHKRGIPSYGHVKTVELAKEKKFSQPQNAFEKSLELTVGDRIVFAGFFGEGHTKDNVIGFFPDDKILFGGCLIKETGAGKGNLEDANTDAWSETVKKIKLRYPQAKIVIPGHGEIGGTELLDYTIKLFKVE